MALDETGLLVKLEASVAKFQKDLDRSQKAHQRFAQRLEGQARQSADRMKQTYARVPEGIAASFDRLKGLALPFAGGLLGGMAAGGVTAITTSIGRVTKEIANLSNEAKRAGVSAEVFQEWKFVAEQNRIGVDALTDGFKELHIRAGEFFLDGTGAGAEAFRKLGYSAEELKKKLQDPSRLMVEILGRLKTFDQSGRSFLLEEIFGGAGGEQFSALIGQGEAALQATIARAHETGAVLDAELIAKAEELDRKFSELTTTAANFGKRVAVALASAGVEAVDFRERLDRIFPNEAEGRAVMGDALYDALSGNRELLDENAAAAERLRERYASLSEEAQAAAGQLEAAVPNLSAWGYGAQGGALATIAGEMRDLSQQFADGQLTAEDFAIRLADLERAAAAAFGELQEGDRVEFGGVLGQLSRLAGVIASVTSLANSLKGALERAAGIDPVTQGRKAELDRLAAEKASIASANALAEANAKFTSSEHARNTATTESLRLERETEAVRKRAKEAGVTLTDAQAREAAAAALAGEAARQAADRAARGSGKGGGKAALDDFAREAQAIRDRTQALEMEAAALVQVTQTQRQHGGAIEFARAKSELLIAAQRAGHALTPELTAGIDRLAQAYVEAGARAQKASDDLQSVEDRGKKGAEALGEMFTSVLTGAQSAEEAVAALLMEIAKAQFNKAFAGMFGDSGAGGFLGGLLGFASGGYTGAGPKHQPAGIVHAGEYVFSSEAVNRLGAGNLESMHRAAKSGALGYASGGLVGGGGKVDLAASGRPVDSERALAPQITISAPVTVNASGGSPEQNADLARQVARESEAMFRALVQNEMVRQMRPGGMLR